MRMLSIIMANYQHLCITITHTVKILIGNLHHHLIRKSLLVLYREIKRNMGYGLGDRIKRCLHTKTINYMVNAVVSQSSATEWLGIELLQYIIYHTTKICTLYYLTYHLLCGFTAVRRNFTIK